MIESIDCQLSCIYVTSLAPVKNGRTTRTLRHWKIGPFWLQHRIIKFIFISIFTRKGDSRHQFDIKLVFKNNSKIKHRNVERSKSAKVMHNRQRQLPFKMINLTLYIYKWSNIPTPIMITQIIGKHVCNNFKSNIWHTSLKITFAIAFPGEILSKTFLLASCIYK